jgi:hypothetical protein
MSNDPSTGYYNIMSAVTSATSNANPLTKPCFLISLGTCTVLYTVLYQDLTSLEDGRLRHEGGAKS